MTIMIQSYMYGSAPPNDPPQSIIRRKNRRKRQATAEDGLNGHGNGNGNGWKEDNHYYQLWWLGIEIGVLVRSKLNVDMGMGDDFA
jgi:hypothetical protein